MADREHPEQNRGFGFITFYNHAAAELARRKLDGSLRCAFYVGPAAGVLLALLAPGPATPCFCRQPQHTQTLSLYAHAAWAACAP